MTLVEIELYQHPYSTAPTRTVIEVKDKTPTRLILASVRSIARQCHWHKYRIGIADMWTRWKY